MWKKVGSLHNEKSQSIITQKNKDKCNVQPHNRDIQPNEIFKLTTSRIPPQNINIQNKIQNKGKDGWNLSQSNSLQLDKGYFRKSVSNNCEQIHRNFQYPKTFFEQLPQILSQKSQRSMIMISCSIRQRCKKALQEVKLLKSDHQNLRVYCQQKNALLNEVVQNYIHKIKDGEKLKVKDVLELVKQHKERRKQSERLKVKILQKYGFSLKDLM